MKGLKMSKAIVFFADGMEECEALLVVDLLRRADIEVTTAAVKACRKINTSHNIKLFADCTEKNADYASADIIILPGGLKGTENLRNSKTVAEQCKSFAANKKVAAICAAPTVLAGLGLLNGKNATMYPGLDEKMNGADVKNIPVSVDGNIITGQALGAAIPFALEIIKQLLGEEKAAEVKQQIVF